eukprot:s625_g21.t1
MKEYWEQYRAQSTLQKPASFTCFWRAASQVWLSEFAFLQIRAASQHAQCSTCVRHRYLVKSLGHHLRARQEQQKHYWRHLRDQYLDRLEYYRLRAESRQGGGCGKVICIIQDGMDQGKVALPRSSWMYAKDFHSFQRPKLHVSLTLVHGYFLLFTITHPDTMKDSNASVETLSHALHLLSTKHNINLAEYHISIQSDNTPREIKNNFTLRWAALQVSCSNVGAMSIRFLRCGHSHEDVDQVFGRLARQYSKMKLAECPGDFVASTINFANNMNRPFERVCYVREIERVRDWSLWWCLQYVFFDASRYLVLLGPTSFSLEERLSRRMRSGLSGWHWRTRRTTRFFISSTQRPRPAGP